MPRVPKKTLPPLTDSNETIGHRLAQYRKNRGLTQKQVADLIGIEQNLVSDYERGLIRLYDEMLGRFAVALKTSADLLLGLKKQDTEISSISLRFIKRIAIIETFSETQKKRILRNLDDAIEANHDN